MMKIPGVGSLVPEADNVAESGDDSEEDEWDYFRVDPKDHSGAGAEQQKQSEETICEKPAQPEGEELDDSMSQLNPNAAEFVPSPTQMMPSMNDILLAESPKKGGVPMEDIRVPSQNEFQEEAKLRPSEMDLEADSPTSPKAKADSFLPDLVSKDVSNYTDSDVAEKNMHNLEFREFLEQQEISYQAEKDVQRTEQQHQNFKEMIDTVSELSSNRAECGDDSSLFMTSGSELQKTVTENAPSFSIMNKSFTEQEFESSDLSLGVSKYDQTANGDEKEFSNYAENESNKEHLIQNDIVKNLEEVPPMSFEVHKEMVPEMEAQPERVQLSEGTSSFEQDETSSPLQLEETKFDYNSSPPVIFETDYKQSAISETEQNEQNFFGESKTLEEVSNVLSVDAKEYEPVELEDKLDTEPMQQLIEDIASSQYGEKDLAVQHETSIHHEEIEFITKTESTSESFIKENRETEVVAEEVRLESTEFEVMNEKVGVNEYEAVEQKATDEFEAFEQNSNADDFGIDDRCEQKKVSELEHETDFVRLEEEFVLDEKLLSPLSPSLKVSSPIPDECTATSTPETVPIGKEASPLAQSPIPEMSSPHPEIMSPSREVSSPVSLEDEMIIRDGPSPVVECFGSLHMPERIEEEPEPAEPQRIVEEIVTVENNVPEMKSEILCLEPEDVKSPELLEIAPMVHQEVAVIEASPFAEEDVVVMHTPPPTPAHISEEALQESLAAVSPEPQQLAEAAEKLAEKVAEVEPEKAEDTSAVITAAAAATVGAVAIGAAALTSEVKPTESIKPKVEEKKEPAAEAKKTTSVKDKKPLASKPTAKASPATKTATPKASSKPASSPTKPTAAATAARTATPKKPATSTTTTTRTTPRATVPPASKPKAATPASKPLPTTAKSASPSPRPRPASAASKPLTNGEVKPAVKRPEPLATKKPATTSTTKPSRPATAPVASRTTTTTTKTTIGSKTTTSTPKPKPATAMNGIANKPRPAGTLTTATARAKTLDKQVKETANKQISSNRTTTATNATKTANSLASSRTVTATATKKTVGPVKSTVTSTGTTKTTTAGKVGVKKVGSTTTTRVTASKSVNKTAASVTSTVSEVIQVQQIVTEAKD